jgi:trehalose utilization protein
VWNENRHEQIDPAVRERYPEGIHGAVAAAVREHLGADARVRVATQDQPGQGLPPEVLDDTDVLTWWGHIAHEEVADELVDRVRARVLAGMGLVVLHSAHFSRIFRRLLGTSCALRWRGDGERELVWTVAPGHPVAAGVPNPLVIPEQEMYGEHFDVPPPEDLVFISSFEGGEVFRSGCGWTRGAGRIFYFSPGDEHFPVYHHPHVRRVVANAVRWCAPAAEAPTGPVDIAYVPRGWWA